MQIAVTFRHMEVDEGVKGYVKGKVQRLEKYIGYPREVHVVLSTEKFRHIAELTIVGNGVTLNSQGKNSDLYAAIDQMVEKMERQIRERKGKGRRKRSNPSNSKVSLPIGKGVYGNREGMDMTPPIERKRILVKPMMLEEAVAQLEVSKKEFLVFINSDSGELNVLCRGKDGGYEWVEPYSK